MKGHLQERIFLHEAGCERAQHLVHDQRGIEDDLAFLFGALDQHLLAVGAAVVEDFLRRERTCRACKKGEGGREQDRAAHGHPHIAAAGIRGACCGLARRSGSITCSRIAWTSSTLGTNFRRNSSIPMSTYFVSWSRTFSGRPMQPDFMAGPTRDIILRTSASGPSGLSSFLPRSSAASSVGPKAMNGLNAPRNRKSTRLNSSHVSESR